MMPMDLNNIDIIKFKNADYCYIISGIRKSETLKLFQNIDFTEKSATL